MPDASQPSTAPQVQRRAVVKGAAWSVPVIALATATPFASASTCATPTRFNAQTPVGTGLASTGSRSTTFVVPAGVTRIEYEVTGGAGGSRSATVTGGSGTLVTGKLSVVPGTTLTLLVGQGGYGANIGETSGTVAGGNGFGNGGTSGVGGLNVFQGGSGGGGSAILVGTTPVVIAGGGGGSGSGVIFPSADLTPFTPITAVATIEALGSTAGVNANDALRTWTAPSAVTDRSVQSFGGDAPIGTTGGLGGAAAGAAQVTGTNVYTRQSAAGTNGGNASLSGANGGNGGTTSYPGQEAGSISDFGDLQNRAMGFTGGGNTGGGGGGGYAGGGGGGAHHAFWQRGTGTNRSAGILGRASGGAGGSSYVAPGAVGGVTPVIGTFSPTVGANTNTAAVTRVPGSIVIKYCPPA